jgi:hypothetical protein
MTRHAPLPDAAPKAARSPDAPRQVAQLRELLSLVEQIAGRPVSAAPGAALDEAARVRTAYGDAVPVLQRRFDALLSEASAWAAAGVEALTRAGAPAPAARRLADELGDSIADLLRLLKV